MPLVARLRGCSLSLSDLTRADPYGAVTLLAPGRPRSQLVREERKLLLCACAAPRGRPPLVDEIQSLRRFRRAYRGGPSRPDWCWSPSCPVVGRGASRSPGGSP